MGKYYTLEVNATQSVIILTKKVNHHRYFEFLPLTPAPMISDYTNYTDSEDHQDHPTPRDSDPVPPLPEHLHPQTFPPRQSDSHNSSQDTTKAADFPRLKPDEIPRH